MASGDGGMRYTIGTLVNDEAQYAAMCASFRAHGFDASDCELIAVRNPTSAFAALNAMLDRARSRYVILCHQDVRLIGDGRSELDACIEDLDRRDPHWAVAGNAGGAGIGKLALRISDPHGADRRLGALPARVTSLDENFIVVRRASRVGFSHDLEGFHLYGADICLVADMLGCSAWVVDFHLEHLSPGRKDASFARAEAQFLAKWRRALRPRWIQTTCTLLAVSTVPRGTGARRIASRLVAGLARRLSAPGTWNRSASRETQQ